MAAVTLSTIAEGVWTDTTPVRILGTELSATMTVLRLPAGDLVLHSPVPLTNDRRREIEALGTVRHLMAPNLFHYSWFTEWAAVYPNAELHAPARLSKKRPDLPTTRLNALEAGAALADSIDLVSIAGCRLGETALFYQPARVLVVADLVHNVGQPEGGWTRFYTKTMGFYDRVALSRVLRWTAFSDKAAARRSVDRLLDFDFETLIVGHGAPITAAAKTALERALSWLG